MRKLNVTELENRIAPSVGLGSFLKGLAQQDSAFGTLYNQFVDGNGNVDAGGAAGAWNNMGGNQVAPVRSSFTLDDSRIISDATARKILSMFGK
jgi:hypothetical protein